MVKVNQFYTTNSYAFSSLQDTTYDTGEDNIHFYGTFYYRMFLKYTCSGAILDVWIMWIFPNAKQAVATRKES
jgi:hypothetical protein